MHFTKIVNGLAHIPFHFKGFTKEKPLWASKVDGSLLMGKVKEITTVGLQQITCLKVKVPQNNFHEYNRMFHQTSTEQWTLDPEAQCRVGDVILIRRAEEHEKPSKYVEYTVQKVIFQHGNFIDPVTKRRVYGANEFEREVELRKGFVKEIFNEPLADEADKPITHEQRRSLQRERIDRRKKHLKSRKMALSDEEQQH